MQLLTKRGTESEKQACLRVIHSTGTHRDPWPNSGTAPLAIDAFLASNQEMCLRSPQHSGPCPTILRKGHSHDREQQWCATGRLGQVKF
jgi:hypothetical protein